MFQDERYDVRADLAEEFYALAKQRTTPANPHSYYFSHPIALAYFFTFLTYF